MTNTNKILAAVGIGIAVGTVLGVLFAPKKGSETRAILAEKGAKLSGSVKETIHESQKKLNSMKEGIKEGLNSINRKVEEVM